MLFIAEIGQAHDGSLGILHSYIDAVASTGVTAVKFQTHIAEAESSSKEPFRVNFSYEDATRYDYWERMEFSKEQWLGIKEHCHKVQLQFISSPFSIAAVNLLEEVGVDAYKIGSGEVSNHLLLHKIAYTGKPVILSSGMSSFEELDSAVEIFKTAGNDLSILQCTTAYPTPPEKLGLNVLRELKDRYPYAKIGLSEHTGEIYAGLGAVALGAEILEFHCVFDKRMFGPDAKSSLTINQIEELVKQVKLLDISLNNPVDKSCSNDFNELKLIFEKTLAINKDLNAGHTISIGDLEAKKPAKQGIPASQFDLVIGKKINKNLKKWDFLKEEHLS